MCRVCDGQGEKIDEGDKCKSCNGKKTKRESKVLEVHVDKGKIFINMFSSNYFYSRKKHFVLNGFNSVFF